MKLSNTVKVVLGIFGTILLGAVGSGFWERILSPFLSYLSSSTTSALSSLSRTYSDSIYTSAAQLFTPNSTEGLGFILLLLVFSWLFYNGIRSKNDNAFAALIERAIHFHFNSWFGIAYCGAMLVFLFFMISRQATIEKIQSYSYRHMEIVRPAVGEQKYAQLRSRYFQVKTKEDFDRFLEDLDASARSAGLPIDSFVLK